MQPNIRVGAQHALMQDDLRTPLDFAFRTPVVLESAALSDGGGVRPRLERRGTGIHPVLGAPKPLGFPVCTGAVMED